MGCTRKHTPIVSQKQRKLFYWWESHPSRKPKSITMREVKSHLREARHKKLPKTKNIDRYF